MEPLKDQKWVEVINQNIQQLLTRSAMHDTEVELRIRPDLGIEIIVDGNAYQDLHDINDQALHDLIQIAIDEWQDKVALTSSNHTPLPVWRPSLFKMSRRWMIGLLTTMIFVFVIPAIFITPTHMALRFSFLCTGSIIGGLIGIWGGRQFGKQVSHKVNYPGCVMSGGILGAFVGPIAGWIIMIFLLDFLFPV